MLQSMLQTLQKSSKSPQLKLSWWHWHPLICQVPGLGSHHLWGQPVQPWNTMRIDGCLQSIAASICDHYVISMWSMFGVPNISIAIVKNICLGATVMTLKDSFIGKAITRLGVHHSLNHSLFEGCYLVELQCGLGGTTLLTVHVPTKVTEWFGKIHIHVSHWLASCNISIDVHPLSHEFIAGLTFLTHSMQEIKGHATYIDSFISTWKCLTFAALDAVPVLSIVRIPYRLSGRGWTNMNNHQAWYESLFPISQHSKQHSKPVSTVINRHFQPSLVGYLVGVWLGIRHRSALEGRAKQIEARHRELVGHCSTVTATNGYQWSATGVSAKLKCLKG